MTNPFDLATEAAAKIAELTGIAKHDIALTLGSGWAKAADLIGETVATIDATEIPGFLPPAVHGHVATIRSIKLPNGKYALILGARSHYYEGHGVRAVVHGIRTAAASTADRGAVRPLVVRSSLSSQQGFSGMAYRPCI